MKFIILHTVDLHTPMRFNVSQITYYYPYPGGTCLHLKDGNEINVLETVDQIDKIINIFNGGGIVGKS